MTNEKLLEFFNMSKELGERYVNIDEIFDELTPEQAIYLAEIYHQDTLIYLPKYEVAFFEWLKEKDYPVWKDLWETSEDDPYTVGAVFLPMLLIRDRGYYICDLLENDNFYFSSKNIIHKTADLLLESLKDRLINKDKLTVAQLLLLEMSFAPIDVWHFAYRYSQDIEKVKLGILELLQDGLIEHWTKAEEVAELMAVE
jgi:hypothetical protein